MNKMGDEGYQGWKNYETWAVASWIDNEESSQEYWNERAIEIKEEGSEHLSSDLADELKNAFDYGNPLGEAGVYSDLLNSALGEVDWYEIAKVILMDAPELEASEDEQ